MPESLPAATPTRRARLGWRGELLLALLPTATVLLLLWLVHRFTNQQLLFASLASSCFLIYLDPGHRTNRVRTLLLSQLVAAGLGYGLHALLGPGYLTAALALVLVILFMVTTDTMHPPAVSTALGFAFRAGAGEDNLLLFSLALGLVLVLVAVQRGATYLLKRLTQVAL